MRHPFRHSFFIPVFLVAATHGNLYPMSATASNGTAVGSHFTRSLNDPAPASMKKGKEIKPKNRSGILTKYEQTCASRFFEFCDYLLTPPDIIIDSASYSAGEKKDEVVMQRERAGDTARIKKAVLRFTVVPEPTNTTDSFHFSQAELSDQAYRNLEKAFSSMEKLLDTCYNSGGTPLKLVPLRLHNDATIRSLLDQDQLSRTFLLQRGKETLAVLLFTPQSRMTPSAPPRICGWSVDFRHGKMIFHNIDAAGEAVSVNR